MERSRENGVLHPLQDSFTYIKVHCGIVVENREPGEKPTDLQHAK